MRYCTKYTVQKADSLYTFTLTLDYFISRSMSLCVTPVYLRDYLLLRVVFFAYFSISL